MKSIGMKSKLPFLVLLTICAVSFAWSAGNEAKQFDKATEVVQEIMHTPDKGIPQDLLDKAVCVGIVPAELKFAIVVGGTYGRGILVCRKGGDGPWGAPSMFTVGGANVGFQIGGKATDVVFIVMNPGGAKKLLKSQVKIGADIAAAAGPLGRTAEGATDAQLHAEILSYSRTRGLFAGVSLEGAVLKQDDDDNQRLYGRKVDPEEVLIKGSVRVPAVARELDNILTKYSPRGGVAFS